MEPPWENKVSVINCIPLSSGVFRESLSYFTTQEVPLGAVITIPVRGRMVRGLVTEVQDGKNLKTGIKNAPFALRRIESVETIAFFSPEFIESAREAATYFATTTGQALSSLIPKTILENIGKTTPHTSGKTVLGSAEKFVVQADTPERFAHYKSLIREEFAKGSSVFFCLPTVEDVRKVKEILEKGVENYTFALHGSLSKKETLATWNKIISEVHPVVIIATGIFLCIPRGDIGIIVLERENSRSYKTLKRPFIDIRTFTEMFARKSSKNLIFGDTLLRVETLWRYKKGEFLELLPLKFRSLIKGEQEIVSMKGTKPIRGQVSVISDQLAKLIEQTKQNHEHLFIFSARKGLSTSVVCQDCGQVVLSLRCSHPIILYKDEKENFFFCPICKEKRSAKELCKNCGGWRLVALGVGIELTRLDRDTVKTHKKTLDVVKKFEDAPSGILLGTELALLYITKIENAAVASMDSLFSIPDFRINEKILRILLTMRSIANKKLLIQTRNPDAPILDFALLGNLADFYKSEIEEREVFGYPPFTVIIKITIRGRKPSVEAALSMVAEKLKEYKPYVFPAGVTTKGLWAMNAVIKVERAKWVDKELLAKLLSLPPTIGIEVDPETLS
jgi:primosomal protein N'